MFSFQVTVKPKDKKYMNRFTKGLFNAVTRCSILTQRNMKIIVGEGGGKPHVPSKPGHPPKRDTGNLTSSIDYRVTATRYLTGKYADVIEGNVGAGLYKLMKSAKFKRQLKKARKTLKKTARGSIDRKSIIAKIARIRGTTMPDYAAYLEFGTDKMARRPYLQPALKKSLPEFGNQFVKAMRSVGL